MPKSIAAICRYEQPYSSVQQAVELCAGLKHMPKQAKVFIKPNIVYWTRACDFPKWGVITTSRVVQDMVQLLKDHGVQSITIGEGIGADTLDEKTSAHAFQALGYETLRKRYAINCINLMQRPFLELQLEQGVELRFNTDILNSDFVINLPVLKTHNQTVVSLGLKNLKGCIDIYSRKKCHSADRTKNLHLYISKLANKIPPMFTLIDGIYTLERGPAFDGRMHRSNLLVASADVLSADMVGARVLGHDPEQVPYLAYAAQSRNRQLDLSDVEIVGDSLQEVAAHHEYDVQYVSNEQVELPKPLAKQGIKGIFYRKFDSSMCTYCSALNGLVLSAIRLAWKGEPWDRVEVLTGKAMQPSPGMKSTILLGQCMYQKNKDHPDIQKMLAVKGCPPDPGQVQQALQQAGIEVDPRLFSQLDTLPGFFLKRYQDKPDFDASFFSVQEQT